jgi:hypothetical protein
MTFDPEDGGDTFFRYVGSHSMLNFLFTLIFMNYICITFIVLEVYSLLFEEFYLLCFVSAWCVIYGKIPFGV